MIDMKNYNKLVKKYLNSKNSKIVKIIIFLNYSKTSISHFKFIYKSKIRKVNFLTADDYSFTLPLPTLKWKLDFFLGPKTKKQTKKIKNKNKKNNKKTRKRNQNNDNNNANLKAHTNTKANNNNNNKSPTKQTK